MTGGLTPRSVRHTERRDLDRTVVRYFVYRLHDTDGVPVYVGRSCDVANRIRSHHSDASSAYPEARRKAEWLFDVRSVSMFGPFTWDQAVREERAEIERLQPRGNRGLTARDHRPAIAARSARRAEGGVA